MSLADYFIFFSLNRILLSRIFSMLDIGGHAWKVILRKMSPYSPYGFNISFNATYVVTYMGV